MAARNYQPTLRRLSHLLNRFIVRWQQQLLAGSTVPQATALAALGAALDQVIAEYSETGGE